MSDVGLRDTGGGSTLAVQQRLPGGASPVLLLHGLGSSATATWDDTGWLRALEAQGYGWIAPDLRGHGGSGKPHEPDSYRLARLVEDVVTVLDGAALPVVDLVGYSLGARIAVEFAAAYPDRVGRMVLGGFGDGLASAAAIQRLLDHLPAGTDRAAVAACAEGASVGGAAASPASVRAPVLLVAGAADTFAGSIESLAAQFADARAERLPERNHFTALSAARFKQVALDFLGAPRTLDRPDRTVDI